MAKKPNQKLKLLFLKKILMEKTDAEHALTLSEISAELAKYDISAERKSFVRSKHCKTSTFRSANRYRERAQAGFSVSLLCYQHKSCNKGDSE